MISIVITMNTLIAQWVQQNSGTNEILTDVIMLDTATAIAVGRDRSILRTSNSGTTWTNVAAPLSFVEPWNSISFFDTANGIIVGDQGSVVTTTNGGKNWTWHTISTTQKCLSAFSIGPSSFYVGTDSGWVYHTSDTGKTWTSEKISEWPIRALFTYRGPGIFLLGVSKYALTPFSICTEYVIPPPSWSESILPSFQGLGSEAFHAEFCNGGGAGFIVGVNGDLRTAPAIVRKAMSDSVWRNVSTGILRDGTFFHVSAPSAQVIYVCGNNGMIYKSANGGDTWLDQTVLTTRNMKAIFFFNEKRGFAVGDSGTILFTANGGSSSGNTAPQQFHLLHPTDGDTMPIMRSISFMWQKAIDLENDSVRYSLLISSDQGASWTTHGPTGDTTLQVQSPAQTPGPYFWMAVAMDGDLATPSLDVFKFTITSPASAEGRSALPTFALYQNFPNPFNPSTEIRFSVGRNGYTSLRVYDVLGREIRVLVNGNKSIGTYTVTFDAANIPGGIYFYRFQAGNYIETKKLIVLK